MLQEYDGMLYVRLHVSAAFTPAPETILPTNVTTKSAYACITARHQLGTQSIDTTSHHTKAYRS